MELKVESPENQQVKHRSCEAGAARGAKSIRIIHSRIKKGFFGQALTSLITKGFHLRQMSPETREIKVAPA